MINKTNIKIPKKYHHMIDEIYEEKGNGYWVELSEGFVSLEMECGYIHEFTQKDVLLQLNFIIPESEANF